MEVLDEIFFPSVLIVLIKLLGELKIDALVCALRNIKLIKKSASKNTSNHLLPCFKQPFHIVFPLMTAQEDFL